MFKGKIQLFLKKNSKLAGRRRVTALLHSNEAHLLLREKSFTELSEFTATSSKHGAGTSLRRSRVSACSASMLVERVQKLSGAASVRQPSSSSSSSMLMITGPAALQSFEIQTPLHFLPPPLSATPTALFMKVSVFLMSPPFETFGLIVSRVVWQSNC